jgi:galactokinase
MKRTVLQDVQELIEGQHLLEIGKLFERLHKKYSSQYDIVCLEGFNVVGYN